MKKYVVTFGSGSKLIIIIINHAVFSQSLFPVILEPIFVFENQPFCMKILRAFFPITLSVKLKHITREPKPLTIVLKYH